MHQVTWEIEIFACYSDGINLFIYADENLCLNWNL